MICFSLQTFGNILIFLRDYIPDWVSIPVANTIIISSTYVLLAGLQKFVNVKATQKLNILFVIVFFLIHFYFSFIYPDLFFRKINFALANVIISFQIAILIFKRTPIAMRMVTKPVGFVFVVVFCAQIFHIIYIINYQPIAVKYFNSPNSESLFLLVWEILIISLTYSLFLMYNKRLITDVNKQEEKFSKAFHTAPFIMFLSKLKNGETFEVNNTIQSIAGFKPNELIGSDSVNRNLWKYNNDRLKYTSNLKLYGVVKEDEYLFRKKSGELFYGLISGEVIEINNEECVISVINDISNRKQAELNLQKSEASLKELNSTKDKFFSIIAHDLKSPFNGILGLSGILCEQVKERNYEGIDSYATTINSSAKHAMALVTNLMEWSRSQTGRMEFTPENVDIIKLIQITKKLMEITAKEKGIEISVNAPSSLMVFVDKAMIETVLRNLISNAVKFTPEKGKVIISLEERKDEYFISVTDSGVGIDKGNFEKLFRIDRTFTTLGTNNEKGTGLGLILCKEFIERHQGKVGLESEKGDGSKFYFTLPKVKSIKLNF